MYHCNGDVNDYGCSPSPEQEAFCSFWYSDDEYVDDEQVINVVELSQEAKAFMSRIGRS